MQDNKTSAFELLVQAEKAAGENRVDEYDDVLLLIDNINIPDLQFDRSDERDFRMRRGLIFKKFEKFDRFANEFVEYSKIFPKEWIGFYFVGLAKYYLQLFDDSIKSLEHALDLYDGKDDVPKSQRQKCTLIHAYCEEGKKNYKKAISLYEVVIEIDSSSYSAFLAYKELGNMYSKLCFRRKLTEKGKLAIEQFSRALTIKPGDLEILWLRSLVRENVVMEPLKVRRDAESDWKLISSKWRKDAPLDSLPNELEYYYKISSSCVKLSENEKALAILETARRKFSKEKNEHFVKEILFRIAKTEMEIKRFGEAFIHIRQFHENYPDYQRSRTCKLAGDILFKKKPKSVDNINKALEYYGLVDEEEVCEKRILDCIRFCHDIEKCKKALGNNHKDIVEFAETFLCCEMSILAPKSEDNFKKGILMLKKCEDFLFDCKLNLQIVWKCEVLKLKGELYKGYGLLEQSKKYYDEALENMKNKPVEIVEFLSKVCPFVPAHLPKTDDEALTMSFSLDYKKPFPFEPKLEIEGPRSRSLDLYTAGQEGFMDVFDISPWKKQKWQSESVKIHKKVVTSYKPTYDRIEEGRENLMKEMKEKKIKDLSFTFEQFIFTIQLSWINPKEFHSRKILLSERDRDHLIEEIDQLTHCISNSPIVNGEQERVSFRYVRRGEYQKLIGKEEEGLDDFKIALKLYRSAEAMLQKLLLTVVKDKSYVKTNLNYFRIEIESLKKMSDSCSVFCSFLHAFVLYHFTEDLTMELLSIVNEGLRKIGTNCLQLQYILMMYKAKILFDLGNFEECLKISDVTLSLQTQLRYCYQKTDRVWNVVDDFLIDSKKLIMKMNTECHFKLKDFEKSRIAAESLKTLCLEKPRGKKEVGISCVLIGRANLFYDTMTFVSGKKELNKVKMNDPDNEIVYFVMTEFYEAKEEFKKAVAILRQGWYLCKSKRMTFVQKKKTIEKRMMGGNEDRKSQSRRLINLKVKYKGTGAIQEFKVPEGIDNIQLMVRIVMRFEVPLFVTDYELKFGKDCWLSVSSDDKVSLKIVWDSKSAEKEVLNAVLYELPFTINSW